MLNIKREYFALEEQRLLYQTSFKDKSRCYVYGRKKFITEAGEEQFSAHAFPISKDFWTISAGQLDFTNYVGKIWQDYLSVVIVEHGEYTSPSINFGSMGDITPENLQELSDYISKHLSDLEKRIVEDYLFIDEGVAENIGLPNLPENHFWVRKNGVIVGVNLDYLKKDYIFLKEELKKDFKNFYIETFEALKKALKKYYLEIYQQATTELTKLKEKLMSELNTKVEYMITNIGDQQHRIVLPANTLSFTLPDTWILSERFKLFADGVLLTPDETYTITGRIVAFKKAWTYPVDLFLNDVLPPTIVEEQIRKFLDNAKQKTTEFNANVTDKTAIFDKNAKNKTIEFNTNHEKKLEIYNNNATLKEKKIDDKTAAAVNTIKKAETTAKDGIAEAGKLQIAENEKEIDDYIETTTKPQINKYVETDVKPKINLYFEDKKIEVNENLFPVIREEILSSFLGENFKDIYDPTVTYYPGDIYKKNETAVISFEIPNVPLPELAKNTEVKRIDKYYKLQGDQECIFDLISNSDNKIVGFSLGSSNDYIRDNDTVSFDIPIINYTVGINIPETSTPAIVKVLTAEEDTSSQQLIKAVSSYPIHRLNTQKETTLRKFNY